MINNGEKNKPLDRYPYMENELKKYDTMQDDIKKLQGDVQEISEVLNALSENVINLNHAVESLTEVVRIDDIFTLAANVNYMEIIGSKVFKVGNAVQVYIDLKIIQLPQTWRNNVGTINYDIAPRPVNMFPVVDPRFIGKVASGSGTITLVPLNDDFITVDRRIALSGFYVIDVGGG